VLDRSPNRDLLGERLQTAAKRTRRLRQRPDDPTFGRVRPAWIVDRDIALEHHLRSVAIAAPGSLRQALDLVALLEPVPFDTERPPWDLTVIDGLEQGRAVLYVRAHHVLTDGMNGLRLMGALFDEVGRPATQPPERRAAIDASATESPEGEHRPGVVTLDLSRVARPVRRGLAAAREHEAMDAVVGAFQRALDMANSVSRQVMVTGGALSPLFDDHSMTSRFEVLSVPRVREVSLALGGSRNDLFISAVARGLGLYHAHMNRPATKLRLATPAGQPHANDNGGNWFAPARVEIPTEVQHTGRLFGIVAERLAQARNEPALRLTAALASTLGRLPTRVLMPALYAQADSVDFAATTLPGLHTPRHICDANIDAIYPLGPRLGCPVNLTALGNEDRLDIGIALDPAAITEPDTFRQDLVTAFDEFENIESSGASLRAVQAPTS
jgi:diacylglycerol O-acyltransferase